MRGCHARQFERLGHVLIDLYGICGGLSRARAGICGAHASSAPRWYRKPEWKSLRRSSIAQRARAKMIWTVVKHGIMDMHHAHSVTRALS